MSIIIQLLFVAINVWMALYHAKLISRDKVIRHSMWATLYCVIVAPSYFISWELPVIGLLIRIPVFNTVLNYRRGKPLFYLGKSSFIDRLIGKHYPYVFAGCITLIIIFNLK